MAQDQYQCETCGATFASKEKLEEHKRTMHSQYTCEVCGQTFHSKSALEEHERKMHPEKVEASGKPS